MKISARFFLIFSFVILYCSYSPAQVKIGLAFPLMGSSDNQDEQREGEFFIKGVQDALAEYNNTSPRVKIEIKTGDTEKDPEKAANLINTYSKDTAIIAVLGPVFSGELKAVTETASLYKLPVISPTATQNNIAKDNEYIFQLNPTYNTRGRIAAKYAVNELGFKNFILISDDTYGRNFSIPFADELAKTDGSIIDSLYYNAGDNNIEEKAAELKQRILEKEKFIDFGNLNANQKEILKTAPIKFSTFDSLLNGKAIVSIYKLFGKNAEQTVNELGITSTSYKNSMKNVVLGVADAFYIPISSYKEIAKISALYKFLDITLPVFGTSDWNNETLLKKYAPKMDLYLESDFFVSDESMKEKLAKLKAEGFEQKNYLFGYDGTKLLLSIIGKENISRNTLYFELNKLNNYYGIHNSVTFRGRENVQLSVLHFFNGSLTKLTDYTY